MRSVLIIVSPSISDGAAPKQRPAQGRVLRKGSTPSAWLTQTLDPATPPAVAATAG